ncbi:hypothetical protein AAGC94_19060 [Clostridium sporogenes]|uniref:hypothetical protein n=1 Tax=Clostridium sporogenes TaxID=1509 RepID=UPI00313E7007
MTLEEFTQQLENKQDSIEILQLKELKNICGEEILFECLRDFYMIAYEAEPIINKDGTVLGNFLDSSIKRAQKSFDRLLSFVDEKVYSKEKVFYIISTNYKLASNEQERKERRLFNKNKNKDLSGYWGSSYDFNKISPNVILKIKELFNV